jgi:hypothetical protein
MSHSLDNPFHGSFEAALHGSGQDSLSESVHESLEAWIVDGSGLTALTHGARVDAPEGFDAVEAYFECITTCSLDDEECITVCTTQLRDHN